MELCKHKEPEGYCPFCARDQYKGEIEAQHNQIKELEIEIDILREHCSEWDTICQKQKAQIATMIEVERLRRKSLDSCAGDRQFNAWKSAREAAFNTRIAADSEPKLS